jgi:hypothetical protein
VLILTYASENWTKNLSDERKTESAEMRFLRPAAGYTLLDQKRNTEVRQELNIFKLTDRIERQKENWYEYILRMVTDGLPKTSLNYKPKLRRIIRRPMNRWEDIFS